jgi:GR25 family glycosyltransferase involved in LPS biosynthesis
MKLNEYFDKIYCINLDKRTDRWEECQKIFSKHGLEVERFSAIDGSKENYNLGYPYDNELAGAISHTKVIEKAKNLKFKNVLILEDDVDFIPLLEETFSKVIEELPKNYDGILFGGNHVGGFRQSTENIVKINRSYALHAYGLNSESFEFTINYMNNKIKNTINKGKESIKTSVAADFFMADLHSMGNWYCFRPHLAWQRSGFSDIQNAIMDYDFLKK